MEWIKCSDELPKDGRYTKYLIVVKWLDTITDKDQWKAYVDTAYFNTFLKMFLTERDEIICDTEETTITHWMPLPEPPKE